jgi:hypothetical protein
MTQKKEKVRSLAWLMWSDLAVKRMVSDLDEYEEEEEEEEEDGRADNSGNGSSLSLRIHRAPVTEAVAPREREEDKGKASRKEEEEIVNERTSGSSNDSAFDSTTASLKVNSHAASNEATSQPMDISSSSSLHLIPAPAPVTVSVHDHLTPTAEIKADVTNLTANHTHSTTGVVSGESASTEACKVEREAGGWTICLPNDPDYTSSGTLTGQNLSEHSDSDALLLPLPPLYTGGTSVGTKRFASMMLKSSQQRPKIGRLHTTGCVALFGPEY